MANETLGQLYSSRIVKSSSIVAWYIWSGLSQTLWTFKSECIICTPKHACEVLYTNEQAYTTATFRLHAMSGHVWSVIEFTNNWEELSKVMTGLSKLNDARFAGVAASSQIELKKNK